MAPPMEADVLSARDDHRAFATLTLAFGSDSMARWLLPDAGHYLTYWPHVLRAFGAPALEQGTADSIDDYSGVALWFPPGTVLEEESMGRAMVEGVVGGHQQEVLDFMEQVGAFHPTELHWYLPFMGVDVTKQGRGYGSALVRHALQRCDADAMPAYLEASSRGSKLPYERHGFTGLGVIQVGSSPPMWPMQRRPR